MVRARAGTTEDSNDPSGLRERKKAQTREAIIDAAIDLFETKGYDATTVEDIAAEANISPRTFFRYFDTKLEVILAESDEEAKGFAQLVAARPEHEGPLEAMHHTIREQAEHMFLGDSRAGRELKVVMSTPSLRNQALEHMRDHEASLVPVLAERLGVDSDALQAHILAGAMTTLIWTIVERWGATGADPDRLLPMVDEGFALLKGELG